MKTCSKCKIEKPRSEFYKRRDSKDGVSYWCKECEQKRVRPKAFNPTQDVLPDFKMCCRCKTIKSSSDFNKDCSRKDGLCTACRECRKIIVPRPTPEYKRCPNCKIIKVAQKFNRNRAKADGLSQWCKECIKAAYYNRARKHKVKVLFDHKICPKCKMQKPRSEFHKNRSTSDGYAYRCKKCTDEYNKQYLKRSDRKAQKHNKTYINNYQKLRRINDINFAIALNLRKRLNQAIKKNTKSGSAVSDLGCTIEEFKIHIESQFEPGMSWDNWTRDGWHIDHIKPLCEFDLTDREQFLEACHYTNLRPLWAKDNLTRSKPRRKRAG